MILETVILRNLVLNSGGMPTAAAPTFTKLPLINKFLTGSYQQCSPINPPILGDLNSGLPSGLGGLRGANAGF
jgi:hypothetical protein